MLATAEIRLPARHIPHSLPALKSSERLSPLCLGPASVRRLRAREHVFYEGDPESHIFQIESGIVRLYRLLPDGRRQIISFRFPGDLIGFEMNEEQFCSAEAVTDVTLRCLPLGVAYRRMREEPRFGSELIGLLTSELAGARAQLAVLNRRSAMEKLAAFILDLWRREGSKGGMPAWLKLELSRGDIADFLGLTVETVSRCLTKLKVQRIIELPETHTLLIKDMTRLEQLAGGGEDR